MSLMYGMVMSNDRCSGLDRSARGRHPVPEGCLSLAAVLAIFWCPVKAVPVRRGRHTAVRANLSPFRMIWFQINSYRDGCGGANVSPLLVV